MVKRILHHTLLGIEFLHANGVAHGDLQQGNLLFPVNDLNTMDGRSYPGMIKFQSLFVGWTVAQIFGHTMETFFPDFP